MIAGLAGGATTLLSLLLAIWSARRIARPIEQIEQGTHALMLRRAITFSNTGLPEVDRTLDALASTARVFEQHDKERDEREAHVRLIMRELSHRSKNLLAIVLAIARQTVAPHHLVQRIRVALQLAHPGAGRRPRSAGRAAMERRVHRRPGAARNSPPSAWKRSTCRGERIMLRTEAVQNVALALHELATNASKYGALSVPAGKVDIDWAWEPGETGERNLRLTWRESGGPPVTAPSKKGFGCFVLERVTVNALGEGGLEFKPDGLVWTCIIQPEHLVDGDNAADAAATGQQAAAGAQPRQLN